VAEAVLETQRFATRGEAGQFWIWMPNSSGSKVCYVIASSRVSLA
jgi:hypothetical protein